MKKSHPKALPFLFFSEMWERFGYYLMIGIFTLYLKDTVNGFSMTEAEASDLYGTFIAFVFLTPFIGGLLADRVLGYRRSITMGGIMMGVGYCLMSGFVLDKSIQATTSGLFIDSSAVHGGTSSRNISEQHLSSFIPCSSNSSDHSPCRL